MGSHQLLRNRISLIDRVSGWQPPVGQLTTKTCVASGASRSRPCIDALPTVLIGNMGSYLSPSERICR
jgi:hypothetical protein